LGCDDHAYGSAEDGDDGSDGEGDGGHDSFFSEEGDDDEHGDHKDEADEVFLSEELNSTLGNLRDTFEIFSPS
jgi:hypothetical protein